MSEEEKKKEYWRTAAEKRRRADGVQQWKGIPAACDECGKDYIRKGRNSKTCGTECAKEVLRRRARAASLAKLRAKGAPQMGDIMDCGHCKKQFERDASRVKYCPECRVLQKKNALPFMQAHHLKYRRKYHSDRMKSDPVYALKQTFKSSLGNAISRMGYTKRNRSYKILGCTWDFFKGYIEAKFQDGMSWDNRGEWELDHIVPVSSATTEDEVIKLNHYSNFQPLWKEQNREKGAKLDWVLNAE